MDADTADTQIRDRKRRQRIWIVGRGGSGVGQGGPAGHFVSHFHRKVVGRRELQACHDEASAEPAAFGAGRPVRTVAAAKAASSPIGNVE